MTMNVSRKGDLAELIACQYFMEQGYEIFRNMGSTGPIDIVVLNPETGEVMYIDVKTAQRYVKQDGSVSYHYSKGNYKESDLDIRYLLVHDNEIVGFGE